MFPLNGLIEKMDPSELAIKSLLSQIENSRLSSVLEPKLCSQSFVEFIAGASLRGVGFSGIESSCQESSIWIFSSFTGPIKHEVNKEILIMSINLATDCIYFCFNNF